MLLGATTQPPLKCAMLDQKRNYLTMIREQARPENIRSDNGSEFIAETVQEFIAETVQEFMAANGIKAITIAPGCPWQNGVIESFKACARRELLDSEQFYTLSEAWVVFAG
jgi:transposase InsO family protein